MNIPTRRIALLGFVALAAYASTAPGKELVYKGTWNTTNRKLDGLMTCIVTRIDKDLWQGRFFGTWQGVTFDYVEKFTRPANNLHGTANIDGAEYEWKGQITPRQFKATFGGNRYFGSFDLRRVELGQEPRSKD